MGVALHHPTTRSDTVGDVDDLLRPQLVEVVEGLVPQDLAVDGSDTVHLVRANDGKVGHTDALGIALLDDGKVGNLLVVEEGSTILVLLGAEEVDEVEVDVVDDLQVTRKQILEHGNGPGLKSLGKNGVVGVSEGLVADSPSFVPIKTLKIDEDTHELSDGDGGMSIVKLDGDIVGDFAEGKLHLLEAAHDILKSGTAEEVLLLQTHLETLRSGLGIKNLGDVLILLTSVEGGIVVRVLILTVELLKIEDGGRGSAPETEVDGVHGAEARDRSIVGSGDDDVSAVPDVTELAFPHDGVHMTAKLHAIVDITTADLPRIALVQPVVRKLSLLTVDDGLLEHTELVTDTITPSRIVEGGERVQEASGKTAKTTITKSRILLLVIEVLKLGTKSVESLGEVAGEAHVADGITKVTTHQVLDGEVVHTLETVISEVLLSIIPELNKPITNTVGGGLVQSVCIKVPLRTSKRELDVPCNLIHDAHGSLRKISLGHLPETVKMRSIRLTALHFVTSDLIRGRSESGDGSRSRSSAKSEGSSIITTKAAGLMREKKRAPILTSEQSCLMRNITLMNRGS